MARLESEMEDMMGYPAARDPSIIDPTTGQPYDDSSRMRQQAEITRQADVKEEFQPVKLPKLLEERVEKASTKEVSTDDLRTAYDDYRGSYNKIDDEGFLLNPKEPLNLSDGETLRPVLRTDNFKSPIDKVVELNYLLTDPSIRDKTKRIVSGLDENTEFGESAIQGFYDSVAKGQGLSATENAWCAAFVHYILTELGADTITSDGGYDAQRARKYVNYGSPVENFKDAKEGDIVIWDWPRNELGEVDYVNGKQDGVGDHVSFHAGTRITDQANPNMISVVGGNQGNKVTLMTRPKKYVLGIRKITKDDINVSLSKDLAKNNPIFKQFVPKSTPVEDMKLMQTPPLANTQQTNQFSIIPSSYNEGGMAMDDQTQMAFALGGEAETVDPVSGNDVPPGSLPEEVRDDIDAKLSEGEYVVPADVVRFFGVKYFEDLRTEAKMGLQQMDADGRIGGEPVQEQEQPQGQEDSMDVAELKAALSESGMYAGGLTDGGSLDTFIDDASRDPMVNGRMRASGATVKMAVGGLAIGNYGDVTKVDGIIKQLMTAANKDPALMEKLASKGIMVNKTGADKKSAEMQQANKPQEPIEAAEGTYVNPFDMGSFDTLGANLFKAAGIKDPVKVIEDTFIKPEGVIEQIVLIGPDGMEIPVAWNSATPIPEGFTKKATNEYGVQANVPTTVSPVAISTQGSRQTGDEGDNGGGEDEPTSTSTGSSFSYTGANLRELEEKYEETKKYANLSNLALVLGPVGGVIKMAVQANHAIVKRRIENELERREKISVNEEGKYDPTGNAFTNLEGKISTLKELKAKVGTKSASTSLLGYLAGDVVDKSFDSIAESKDKKAAADLIQDEVMKPLKGSGFEDSGLPAAFSDSFLSSKQKGYTYNTADDGKGRDITVKPETGLEKVTRLKREQEVATARRLEKERKEREAREAAQRAAAATAARNSAAQREIDRLNRENRDDSDPWAFDIGSDPAFTSGDADYNSKPSYGSISSGGLYQEGGLVSMPAAAKKQKKRKTQRRKGLGTRP